jgi:hypothetical protein
LRYKRPPFSLRLALFLILAASLTYSQQAGSNSVPLEPLPPFSGSNAFGSTYVSLDSWIYQAFDRLHALGYVDTAYLGLRPWARLACLHMLQETSEKLSGALGDAEARRLFNALAKEFTHEINIHDPGKSAAHAEVDSVYGRAMGIAGPPINDSYHFGQTITNDYGRPYQEGFNAISGFSARAEDFRFTLKNINTPRVEPPTLILYAL